MSLLDEFNALEVDDDAIEHFGVKGMKWGVRNDRGHEGERVKLKKLPKLDKKWQENFNGVKGFIAVHNGVADKMNNGRIAKVNNKPEFKNVNMFDPKNKKISDKYFKEMADQQLSAMHEVAREFGTNPSGTKKLAIVKEGDDYWIRPVDITHGDFDDLIAPMEWKLTKNSTHITGVEKVDEAAAHSDDFDDFLEHYGVKGMKWGVHRSEKFGGNPGVSGHGGPKPSLKKRAGSAIDAGKAHVKKEIKERTDVEVHVRAKPGQMVRAVGGNKRPAHVDAVNARVSEQVAKRSTLDALSNKDLQHLVNRMNLEAQYRNLAVKETRASAGEKFLLGLISEHGDKAAAKLGPAAALGKAVLNFGVKATTGNKGLMGGSAKGDKDKKD